MVPVQLMVCVGKLPLCMVNYLLLCNLGKLMKDNNVDSEVRTSAQQVDISDRDANFSSGIAAFETKSFKQAMQFLQPLAYEGDAESQHRCSIMYQNGLGCVVNEDKAFEFMYSAASHGHAIAQHGLGFMYMEGECTEKNPQEAVKWFSKAAEQGLVGSMTTLAMMYQEGNGVEKNPQEAKRLYKLAGFDDM